MKVQDAHHIITQRLRIGVALWYGLSTATFPYQFAFFWLHFAMVNKQSNSYAHNLQVLIVGVRPGVLSPPQTRSLRP